MDCPRCGAPLMLDQGVLDDARRQGMALAFIPLRCHNAHTARIERPRGQIRIVPTCGLCERPVFDRRQGKGAPLLNHPACVPALTANPKQRLPHRWVEVSDE